VKVPAGASGSSRISTRLFVPAGIISHDTEGDSFAPVQVLIAGTRDPGVSEPTCSVNEPADPIGDAVREGDPTETGTGADDEPGAEHPVIPVTRIRRRHGTRNDRKCIPGRGYVNT